MVGDGLYLPGDAVAMMVPTSLSKMQMRRVLDPRFHQFFLSRSAAESWLQSKAAVPVEHPHAANRTETSTNFFGRSLLEARTTGK